MISKYPKINKIDKKTFFKLDKIKILSENSILIFYSYKKQIFFNNKMPEKIL